MAKCHKIKAKITMNMVISKLFRDIVEIGWVRVIYDGSGNFQVFFGIFMTEITRTPMYFIFFIFCQYQIKVIQVLV